MTSGVSSRDIWEGWRMERWGWWLRVPPPSSCTLLLPHSHPVTVVPGPDGSYGIAAQVLIGLNVAYAQEMK